MDLDKLRVTFGLLMAIGAGIGVGLGTSNIGAGIGLAAGLAVLFGGGAYLAAGAKNSSTKSGDNR